MMETNESGVIPVEYHCVVKLDKVEEKSAGGIIFADDNRDRSQMAATHGVLLAVGGNAFHEWADPIPKAGDRVVIRKYAGQFKTADPEDLYRVLHDKDIVGILAP